MKKKPAGKPIPGAPSQPLRRPLLSARPWSALHMDALSKVSAADIARARLAWLRNAPARAKGLLAARRRV